MSKLVFKKKHEDGNDQFKEPGERLKVLIVDDEEDVHSVTRFALKDYEYNGKKLEFISAYSGNEGKKLIRENPDASLVLLDIVMEEDDSGLQVAKYIREELDNQLTRIILRTGQPGMAPEQNVIFKYDVNDYKEKTELTSTKFITVLTMALRSYSDLMTIESFRYALEEKVKERTIELEEKNEKLIKLNEEKNEFLWMAAHDLKNPLSIVSGFAELIVNDYETLEKEQILTYGNQIQNSAKSMLLLVENLLDVEAIESENRKISVEKFDLNKLARAVVHGFEKYAQQKDINLLYEPLDEECAIEGDPNSIKQVLENITSNAIKYSPMKKKVLCRLSKKDGKARFMVRDEGPGLTERDMGKLFGKFCRLSAKPTGQERSTGLGLYIVKKLVEEMKGKVWCESELGKGASFFVEFGS